MYKILGADQKEYGPVTADQMRQWIAEGRANAQTMILADGTTEWKPLSTFPEFSADLSAGRPVTSQPLYPSRRANGLAITSMVMGILSIVLACCCYGLPFNVLGVIFAIIAFSQIKADPENQTGKGFAMAGLIMSCVSFLLAIVLVIIAIAGGGFQNALRDLNKL